MGAMPGQFRDGPVPCLHPRDLEERGLVTLEHLHARVRVRVCVRERTCEGVSE